MILIRAGVVHVEDALGFTLDCCIGEMIFPLAYLGVVPKEKEEKETFSPYPSRYCPLDYPIPPHGVVSNKL